MKLKPRNDQVIVAPLEAEDRSPGGIFIPEKAKTTPTRGTVVAIGPGALNDNGERVPLDIQPGDTVLFGKYNGNDIELSGEKYKLLREADIFAVIEG